MKSLKNFVNFVSQPSIKSLKTSVNETTLKLLSNFTTQDNDGYCGIASAVMVLNAANLTPPIDPSHPAHQYFTQSNFFTEPVKKIITPEHVAKHGCTLTQLSAAIQTHGVNALPFYSNRLTPEETRRIISEAMANNHYVIVDFLRTGFGLSGKGHHSPIAAYDSKANRFLVLDVARFNYPAYWVHAKKLWKGINTLDDKTARGFIVISDP